jgi:hypothetical protein
MSLSKKAIGKRFGLLAAFVAALLIACTGVVLAQSSSSTPNASYGNTTVTPNDVDQTSATAKVTSATGGISAAADVRNGGFETGDFSGWSRANRRFGDEIGNWRVYEGTTSPLSEFIIAAPPQGIFAATTDQSGPGTHLLFRKITLKPGMEHKLSFFLYYNNRAEDFSTPKTLDFEGEPNQQYRVDILKREADFFTMNSNALLANVFRTRVGDPLTLGPTFMTFNLTPFAGQTVRLRFAEVDNEDNFLASVDRVKVKSTK